MGESLTVHKWKYCGKAYGAIYCQTMCISILLLPTIQCFNGIHPCSVWFRLNMLVIISTFLCKCVNPCEEINVP